MSAFMVDKKTIDRVITGMQTVGDGGRERTEDESELGVELLAMNARAMNARYGDEIELEDYRFTPRPLDSRCQLFKAMRCFLYQCSEGDVPEESLFKRVAKAADALCHEIVTALPQYDRAEWG